MGFFRKNAGSVLCGLMIINTGWIFATDLQNESIVFNKFLGPWKVAGPVSVNSGGSSLTQQDSNIDPASLLPTSEGEKKWIEVPAGAVNLSHLFASDPNHLKKSVAAVCEIESPGDQEVILSFAADDSFQAYLNGEKVLGYDTFSGMYLDRLTKKVRLKKGKNRLVATIYNADGDWAFAARLLPVDSRPIAEFVYHKNFSYGNAILPSAQMELLSKTGEVIGRETVDALRIGWATPSVYRLYSTIDGNRIDKIRVIMDVPGNPDQKFDKTFSKGEWQGAVIGLPGNIKISGKVLDKNTSQPLSETTIRLSETTKTVTTDNDGSFTMDGVDPASIKLFAIRPGYGIESRQIEWRTPKAVNFELSEDATLLKGRVSDTNNNPIEGAEVFTDKLAGELRIYTDKNGEYFFHGPGGNSEKYNLKVYARHPNYLTEPPAEVELSRGKTYEQNFLLRKGELLPVVLKDAKTGLAIKGGRVVIAGEIGGQMGEFKTDASGTANIKLDEKVKKLLVIADGYAPTSHTLAGRTEGDKLTLSLDRGSTVSRNVFLHSGKPFTDGLMQVYYNNVLTTTVMAQVDGKGVMVYPNVPADGLRFSFLQKDMQSGRHTKHITPTALDETQGPLGKLVLNDNLLLYGTLLDAQTEKPINGIVRLTVTEKQIFGTNYNITPIEQVFQIEIEADAGGRFFLDRNTPYFYRRNDSNSTTTYQLEFSAPHYNTFTLKLQGTDLNSGKNVGNVLLTPRDKIVVQVRNPDGTPAVNTLVRLEKSRYVGHVISLKNFKAQDLNEEYKTDSAGTAELSVDKNEKYDLYAQNDRGAVILHGLSPYAKNQIVQLKHFSSLEGIVLNQGAPIANKEVSISVLFSGNNRLNFTSKTDEHGYFLMDKLPEGTAVASVTLYRLGKYDQTVALRASNISLVGGQVRFAELGRAGNRMMRGVVRTDQKFNGEFPGKVSLEFGSDVIAVTDIDSNGEFWFKNIPWGSYNVNISHIRDDGNPASMSKTFNVPENSAEVPRIEFSLVNSSKSQVGDKFLSDELTSYDIKKTTVKANAPSVIKIILPLHNWYSDNNNNGPRIASFLTKHKAYLDGKAQLWLIFNKAETLGRITDFFDGEIPDYVKVVRGDEFHMEWLSSKGLRAPFVLDSSGQISLMTSDWKLADEEVSKVLDRLILSGEGKEAKE